MQLELSWFAPGSVRGVLMDYLAMRSETVTGETRERDYEVQVNWLMEIFGEGFPAESVTFAVLEKAARGARGVLRDVTIRRRFRFWRAAAKYAAQRGVLPWSAIPTLPPWLKNDGVRCEDYYTPAQFAGFRMALPPDRFRRYADLGMWTGLHTHDLIRTQRWMLQPDHIFEGADQRGRWWRRNHKNKRSVDAWIPMEPELRDLAIEWMRQPGEPKDFIVGSVSNLRRYFHIAAMRAEVPVIRPNLGLRASHATLLLARGYSYEYVRLVLGHEGETRSVSRADGESDPRPFTARPSVLSRHYLRSSPETLRPK